MPPMSQKESHSNIGVFFPNTLIFLDTSFLIAFFNKKDKNFDYAREIIKVSLEKDNTIKFIVSDYVFDELITLLKSKKIPVSTIGKIGNTILSSRIFKMIIIKEDIFKSTWSVCKKYTDKSWSFTDISCFCLMDEYGINYYLSFDKHFSQYPKIQKWNINF